MRKPDDPAGGRFPVARGGVGFSSPSLLNPPDKAIAWHTSRSVIMYPSGQWEGFWVQEHWGRQSMRGFELHFAGGEITGGGRDVVGAFKFVGKYDPATGRVTMVKQYHLKHRVMYDGVPDGEGSIAGTWNIGTDWTGSFLIRPVVPKPTPDAPILDLT